MCYPLQGSGCKWPISDIMFLWLQDNVHLLSTFQPELYDWCNKGYGMCYPVCGMVHIKEPLLLIGKSSICGGSGFPLLLWSFTICPTPYNRKIKCVECIVKYTFPSFLPSFYYQYQLLMDVSTQIKPIWCIKLPYTTLHQHI